MVLWVLSTGMSLHDYNTAHHRRLITLVVGLLVLAMSATTGSANAPSPKVVEMFPPTLGSYRQLLSMRPLVTLSKEGVLEPSYFASTANSNESSPFLGGETEYVSAEGNKFLVEIVRVANRSGAYSLLTLIGKRAREKQQITELSSADVGTASVISGSSVAFFKGTIFARVTNESSERSTPAVEFARLLAGTFDKGEDDIPVLVRHLPNWETSQRNAVYAVNVGPLHEAIPNQTIFDVLSFEGGTEAVVANYDQSQLVIVEFTTPQFSVDNDSKIWTKIAELKSQGRPTPSAYRRVGNYSVFVFNAPDERAANALIDQVKYEQVVQWLGDDPHLYERLQRYLTQTSAGVLVAVLKSSGLSLLLCLAAGALIGTMLFRHRRAQRAAAYSDAGGSIRLNLDDLTGPANTDRLLKSGSSSDQSSSNS